MYFIITFSSPAFHSYVSPPTFLRYLCAVFPLDWITDVLLTYPPTLCFSLIILILLSHSFSRLTPISGQPGSRISPVMETGCGLIVLLQQLISVKSQTARRVCVGISSLNWNTGQSTTQWERKAQVQKQWNVLETFALYVKLGIPRDLQGEWETRRQTVEAFETVHTHNGLTLWEQLLFQLLCDGKKHPAVAIVCVLLDCKQARTFGVCV